MKSILHQLKKYMAPASTQVEIKLDDKMAQPNDELAEIAQQIAYSDSYPEVNIEGFFLEIRETRRKKIYSLLQSMLPSDNAGKLYPKITLARYHLGYNCQMVTSEEATDAEIKEFLKSKPIEQYRIDFTAACNQSARKMVMIRALLATFNFSKLPADNLPVRHRDTICRSLGVPTSITIKETVKLQESTERNLSINELILGRLGYIIVWRALQERDLSAGHRLIGNLSCKTSGLVPRASITLLPPGQVKDDSSRD